MINHSTHISYEYWNVGAVNICHVHVRWSVYLFAANEHDEVCESVSNRM